MKARVLAILIGLISSSAFAQTPAAGSTSSRPPQGPEPTALLTTPIGHELTVHVGAYDYVEPGNLKISIHGAKVGGGYTGAWTLSRRHWFVKADARGSAGRTSYDGWCAPYLITPDSTSPNGYAFDIGEYSPCSESGDRDWYLEGRTLIGKDFVGRKWGVSPETGLGVRHLSNGIAGIPGFRTDEYLYVPFGLTARTGLTAHTALSMNIEYDQLLHGWQNTHESQLGSGTVPATATAPAFTIEAFSDLGFAQHPGWALRASAKYQVNKTWSIEPSYVYWHVSDSPVSAGTVTFTVNGVTVDQQFGAREPENYTHEFVVKLGWRF
jgi:hypothetical protein